MSKVYKSININNNEKKLITHSLDKYINEFDSIDEMNDINGINESINYDQINLNDNNIASEEQEEEDRWIREAREEALRIVQQAKEEAEAILETEKEKIEEWWAQKRSEDTDIVEKAKKSGYDRGFIEGKLSAEEEINKQYQAILEQAQNILKKSYEIKEEIIRESEMPIIELSISVAEKIIKKEVDIDKNIIISIANEALKSINEFEKISIYVKPENFAYLHSARDDLLKGLNGQVELMIFPDSSINDDNGCIIRTSSGTLDAKIDTQLEEIKKIIFEVAGRREE